MPQYQGVWSLQQQMQALTSGQWATDPLFDYTTLLLQADNAANSAQNNTFLDSSTNAFAITRNGNTTQGTFSPFSATGWSNFFDGTGDYLSLTGGVTDNGTGDLTLEFWSFYTGSYSTEAVAFDSRVSPFTNGFAVTIAATSGYWTMNFASQDILTAVPAARNAWQHVAVTRSGNTFRLFVDGVLRGTLSSSNNLTNNTNKIGASYNNGSAWSGYISNLRAIKGSIPTAYQTSSTTIGAVVFNPPTTPLTAVSGTSLLTCQANRFLDASTNAFTITPTGDSSVQAFSPFAPQFQYTATGTGGSGYSDGTGDYLTVATNANLTLGSSDFTIELWWYPTAFNADGEIFTMGSSGGTNRCYAMYSYGSNGTLGAFAGTGGSTWDIVSNLSMGTARLNSWNHMAFTRSGSTFSTYLNGSRIATTTASGTLGSNALGVFANNSGTSAAPAGYIGGARTIKGTALYTGATYTIPTAPFTAVTNTNLLLNFTNAGILDGTMKNDLETVGNASVSTSVVKYGSGSMYFDGTGDYVVEPTNVNFGYGTGDFTIEFWLYVSSFANDQTVFSNLTSASSTNPHIYIDTPANVIKYYTANADRITGSVLNTGQWYHIAVCRSNANTRLFINGVQSGSTYADTNDYGTSAPLGIGTYWTAGAPSTTSTLNGYMDDIRVTKGIARYTQNFIPPSVALPRQ